MKTLAKFCFLLSIFSLSGINSHSQIKVSANNYVGINYSAAPLSRFVINHQGGTGYQAYMYNPDISISGGALGVMTEMGNGSGTHIRAITATTNIGSNNYLYGIKSYASGTTTYTSGRTYGIYAQAGNATSGYNYAVYGYLNGTNNGAAVFGTTSGDVELSQQWAGYFKGDTKIEGTLWVNSTTYTSDEKFKTNISSLESTETITNILKINPVRYNLKQYEVSSTAGDTLNVTKYFDESSQLFLNAKYGVIAQELQKIYPELVYTDGDGNLGVDYIELVPILIKAVQVQQRKIDEFQETIDLLSKEVNLLKAK